MKTVRSIVSALLLTTAFGVTIGAMYVTTNAAQDGVEMAPLPLPLPNVDLVPEVPTEVSDIAPDDVLHNRIHGIRLDESGSFTGRISTLSRPEGNLVSASGMRVKLIRKGQIQGSTSTDSDGTFTFNGLKDGVSSLFAWGDGKLMLFSIRLLDQNNVADGGEMTPVKAGEVVDLAHSSVAVDSVDSATAAQLIFSNLPSDDWRFESDTEEQQQKEGDYPYGTGETSTSLNHHAVQLQNNGNLV